MKIGIYFCNCGTNISEMIDSTVLSEKLCHMSDVAYFKTFDFLCSEEGEDFLKNDIAQDKPDRIVIAACSPRDQESTFMRILSETGINPYLMQIVNIREQVAWVTPEREKATQKALNNIKGSVKRIGLHEPLEKKRLDVTPHVVIIGAGPAGLKTALTLARAGRKVVLVEKAPLIGGIPLRFEEVFPNMECSPCMLTPLVEDVLHGDYASNIEILTLSEVVDVVGFYGNFTVTVRQSPRYVDTKMCIGCGQCIEQCPASAKNVFNYGLDDKKAISLPLMDAIPNIPFIDITACLRTKGEDCQLCQEVCEVEGAIQFNDRGSILQKNAGAIVVATGGSLYDCSALSNLGYRSIADTYNALEFERILSASGPTGGELIMSDGREPESCAIVHCVGSLDNSHKDYCSGICCNYAFKFSHMISTRKEDMKIYHFYKELSVAGKEVSRLYHNVKENPHVEFIRYNDIGDLRTALKEGKKTIDFSDTQGNRGSIQTDMIILCPAVVPSPDSEKLSRMLGISRDKWGFFQELHGRLDSTQSEIKGIYLAGTCHSPMDIDKTMNQAVAVSGSVLSELIEGKQLEIEPITASVQEEKCGGCKVCLEVCPYKALSFNDETDTSCVNEALCRGCGTCAAACPAGAITCKHFKTEAILAEMEGILT
jgi:heterodisulfide reductase subunit A